MELAVTHDANPHLTSGGPARSAALPGPQASLHERILDVAESLIATHGVFGFILKDLAGPLAVRVPTIYEHYSSRDDVLIALRGRFIDLLSMQFTYAPEALADPRQTLQQVVGEFARFHMTHPAYVRLSLADLATPEGGMAHVRLAAGGVFRSNLTTGPLAPMHRRLGALLQTGQRAGAFQEIHEVDFYRLIQSALLIRLVFPDDLLIPPRPSQTVQRNIERMLCDVALRHIIADPSGL